MRISDWSSDVCSSDLGIPDVAGRERARYAGRRVLVIGGGHSAINAALALLELQGEAPGTEIFWALRRHSVQKLLGGGLNDQLPARGALGLAAKRASAQGARTGAVTGKSGTRRVELGGCRYVKQKKIQC